MAFAPSVTPRRGADIPIAGGLSDACLIEDFGIGDISVARKLGLPPSFVAVGSAIALAPSRFSLGMDGSCAYA